MRAGLIVPAPAQQPGQPRVDAAELACRCRLWSVVCRLRQRQRLYEAGGASRRCFRCPRTSRAWSALPFAVGERLGPVPAAAEPGGCRTPEDVPVDSDPRPAAGAGGAGGWAVDAAGRGRQGSGVNESLPRSPEGSWKAAVRRLEREEARLAACVADDEMRFAGLKNLDHVFGLCATRFSLALHILDGVRASGEPAPRMYRRARQCAVSGLALLEELQAAGISSDQRELIGGDPGYRRARELFEQLVLRGGGALLEPEAASVVSSRALARIVTAALRKYAARDDTYAPLFHSERLPLPLRRLLRSMFATVAPEGEPEPPYGIEHEEDQELLAADHIRLPLSQAILLFEQEILPALRHQLVANPGDPRLQQEIAQIEHQLQGLQRMRFIPRSTPIVLEKGFYTEWFSGFTADGEALVSVPLRVTFRGGTNLDRMQELITADIARRVAGRGICPELDASYEYLRSLESGIYGSSRTPSLRLNARRGFRILKQSVPALARLEDRAELRRLLALVAASSRWRAERQIEAVLTSGRVLPRLEGER